MKLFYILIYSAVIFSSCFDIKTGQAFQHIAPNAWRGVFITDATTAERVPTLFDVKSDETGKPQKLIFYNGSRNLETDSLRFWGDTLFAYFGQSKTYLRLIYEVNLMEGKLFFENENEYPIVFQAQSGKFPRFPEVRRNPTADVSGSWKADYAQENIDSMQNLQIDFQQKDNNLNGEIKISTKTAYLTGCIQGNLIYLSGFDGEKIYFLSAIVQNDKSLARGKLSINSQKYVFNANR